MTQLKNNSYYKDLASNEHFKGQVDKVDDDFNSLKVSVQTNKTGTLTIFHSVDGLSWSNYGDVFAITTDSHQQVTLKGKYLYVSYLNGALATTNNFNLVSYLSKVGGAMDVNVVNSVVIDGMNFNESGALITTGGGGGGGDASSANQLDQITEAQLTNTKLDTINTTLGGSLSVTETNPIDVSLLATSAKQDTMITDLGSIVTAVQGNLSVTETNPIDVSLLATSAKQDTMITDLGSIVTAVQGNLSVTETNPIDVSALATSAKQDTMITDLGSIVTAVQGNLSVTETNPIDVSLLATSAKQDTMITDLGSIVTAVQGNLSVTETNPIDVSALATSAKQDTMITDLGSIVTAVQGNLSVTETNPIDVSALATESTLEQVSTTAEDISLQLFIPQRSWVEVDFDTQSSLIVQGAGTWRVPVTGEEGWEYVNTSIGGSSLYFYSNTALVAGGLESDITLGSLTTMWFIGNYRLATEVNPNRRFYLSVYTKPQGAGDFQPWYRSSKTYQLSNSAIVSKGADVMYYAGLDISTIYKEYDHTAYELAVSRGNCASDEVIQFMSIGSDSATPANEFDGIIKHAGFSTASGTNRVVSFTRASREKIAEDNLKSLTVEMGALQVNMGGFTFNGADELQVTMPTNTNIKCDGVLLTQTASGTKNCLDVQVNNITACDTGSVVIASGSVTETNPITGFALESTLEPIKLQTDKLTFVDIETNTNNLKVIDLEANNKLGQFSFFTNEDTVTDLRVRVQNAIEVINPEGQTLAISGNVGLVADQTIGITGSVQAHGFASSNGTDWHHLASDANGRIITLSRTHDGSGNDITSTVNGGIRALDVAVSGTTTISGVVDSRAQTAFMPSVIENQNVTGPVQIGTTVDIEHFLWISAIIKFTSVTNGGNIFLEVSPDGSNFWARPSGAQVFINTSVTNTTGAILLSSPVSMRYVRLWADTGFIGVSGTAYVCCK